MLEIENPIQQAISVLQDMADDFHLPALAESGGSGVVGSGGGDVVESGGGDVVESGGGGRYVYIILSDIHTILFLISYCYNIHIL